MSKKKMVAAADNVLKTVLRVTRDDKVFIVTDEKTEKIGEAFERAASDICSKKTEMYVLTERDRPLEELPEDLGKNLDRVINAKTKGDLIFLNTFTGYLEETPFRLQLIRKQKTGRSKVGHAPGITEDMMLGGSLTADYGKIIEEANDLMDRFRDASRVNLSGPAGTDIDFMIEDRPFETDVVIPRGAIGNLPAGEIWCAPVEDSAEGVFVCDGSIGDIGPVPEPVTLKISKGEVVSIECMDRDFGERVRKALSLDEMSNIIGEFGIGLNPMARLTGNLLEDEKAGGTSHIAFGNNIDMPGGRNNSKTHRDFLMNGPTILVRYKDGTKATLVKRGEMIE